MDLFEVVQMLASVNQIKKKKANTPNQAWICRHSLGLHRQSGASAH
jgi:hypothetical protein